MSEFSSVTDSSLTLNANTSVDKTKINMSFPIYIINDTGTNNSKCNIAYYLNSRSGNTISYYDSTTLQTGVLYFDVLTGKPFAYLGNKYNGDSIYYLT